MVEKINSSGKKCRHFGSWVLLALAVSHLAHAESTPQEYHEAPYLQLEVRVNIDPATGKQSCTYTPEPEFTLCGADPQQSLCKHRPKRTDERAQELHEKWEVLQQKVEAFEFDRFAKAAERYRKYRRRHGQEPSAKLLREFSRQASEESDRKIRQLTEADRPKVEKAVAEATTIFKALIDQTWTLTSDEQEILKNIVSTCNANLAISAHDDYRFNGTATSVTNGERMDDLAPYHGKNVSPVIEGIRECHLSISPKLWIECSEGTPTCAMTLFHEMGHWLNSCTFRTLAIQYEQAQKRAGLLKDDDPEYVRQLELRKIGKDGAQNIAAGLEDATACLATISNPKDALPNSCRRSYSTTEDFEKHCAFRTGKFRKGIVEGYPSQWDEAEADFWGASAWALWLEKKFPKNVYARHEAVSDVIGQWCAHEERIKKHVEDEEKERKKRLSSSNLKAPVTKPKAAPDPCELKPRKGYKIPGAPWHTAHQSWPRRFNRNYLRNADLRQTLGCVLSANVPVACSPKGILRSVQPDSTR